MNLLYFKGNLIDAMSESLKETQLVTSEGEGWKYII